MKTMPSAVRKKPSGGFTLVEVLISVLILAIGLLGLAALQVTGLRNNHSAYLRAQATQLAYDMSDRMRANPVAMRAGSYNQPTATQNTACLSASGCNTAAMAGQDAYEWDAALTSQLPSGGGIVCIDSTPDDGTSTDPACDGSGSIYAIKVWWDDTLGDTTDPLKVFTLSFRP